MKLTLFAGLLIFTLAGCATQPPLPLPGERAPLGPLEAQAVPEVYGLRVDVDRIPPGQDQLANDLKSAVPSAPSKDPSQYAWVGVYMGNGLFVDSNGNLAVDLYRLYKLEPQFQILETVQGLVPYQIKFERSGDTFQRAGGGSNLPDAKVDFSSGEIDLTLPDRTTQPSIMIDKGVTYDAHGFMNAGQMQLQQERDNYVNSPSLLGGYAFIVKKPDLADYGSRFIVRKEGNVLMIRHPSMLMDSGKTIQYELTPTGCAFTDMSGSLHTISRVGNLVTVTVNGKVDRTYELLKS